MKRILYIIISWLMLTSVVYAAGAVTTCSGAASVGAPTDRRFTYTCSFTGDNGTGAFTSGTVNLEGYIIKVITDPGSTGPTDNYDIVINGPTGADIMGGALANRDISNTELAFAYAQDGMTIVFPYAFGAHTVVVTNNSVNSATFVLYITVQR